MGRILHQYLLMFFWGAWAPPIIKLWLHPRLGEAPKNEYLGYKIWTQKRLLVERGHQLTMSKFRGMGAHEIVAPLGNLVNGFLNTISKAKTFIFTKKSREILIFSCQIDGFWNLLLKKWWVQGTHGAHNNGATDEIWTSVNKSQYIKF